MWIWLKINQHIFFRTYTMWMEADTFWSSCLAVAQVLLFQRGNIDIRHIPRFYNSYEFFSNWGFVLGQGLNRCFFCPCHLYFFYVPLAPVWIQQRKKRTAFKSYLAISIFSPHQVSNNQ